MGIIVITFILAILVYGLTLISYISENYLLEDVSMEN